MKLSNFISRIVNKLGKKSKEGPETSSISISLYDYLMNADNAKIILLTGTPIINYPNELGIMYNILRGKIKTWSIQLNISKERKVTLDYLKKIFKSNSMGSNIVDYIDYKPTSTTLTITRNPFGFVNVTDDNIYKGVTIGERGEIDDTNYIKYLTNILSKYDININTGSIRVDTHKALPDKLDDFKELFLDEKNNVKNMNIFKRRILGLTSYFRSAQENLMPSFRKSENFHIENIVMSDFQFGVYEEARIQERKIEKQNAKKRKKGNVDTLFDDSVSTYRIFSRAFCNFVFPRPEIKRPMPTDFNQELIDIADEDMLDAASEEEKLNNIDGRYEAEEANKPPTKDMKKYEEDIKKVLTELDDNKEKYLSPEALVTYSPKFLRILENILNDEHIGSHLIYSQFRTLEGIGILKLVLEANGFAQFKIKKNNEEWVLDIKDEDKNKPKFVLYTGTESSEEKELIRNIFNNAWKNLSKNLLNQIQELSDNNIYGEIIKVFMITASGAEGISLKNVRYVHITEPYWHPVRIEQVIGRARRICSHQELPLELRTVDVFLYLMVFSDSQLESDGSIELRLNDKSKLDSLTPVTTDQALYEISSLKEEVTKNLLHNIKESSIDCSLHSKEGGEEQLKCLNFGSVDPNKFSFVPSYNAQESDNIDEKNKTTIKLKAVIVKIEGIEYAYNKDNKAVYDLDSYKRGQPVQIGTLEIIIVDGKKKFKFIRI